MAELANGEKSFGLDQPSIVVSWELDNASASASASTSAAASGTAAKPRPGEPVAPPGSGLASASPSRVSKGWSTRPSTDCPSPSRSARRPSWRSWPSSTTPRCCLSPPARSTGLSSACPAARSPSRASRPTGGPTDWTAEPGTDLKGIDLSRFSDLVKQLSQLHTTRFYQYEGPIPAGTGLLQPRLVLELFPADNKPPHVLRLGASLREGQSFAASGTSSSGPVFFLPALAWDALIQSATPAQELPPNVFVPG